MSELGRATEQLRKGWTDIVAGDFGGGKRARPPLLRPRDERSADLRHRRLRGPRPDRPTELDAAGRTSSRGGSQTPTTTTSPLRRRQRGARALHRARRRPLGSSGTMRVCRTAGRMTPRATTAAGRPVRVPPHPRNCGAAHSRQELDVRAAQHRAGVAKSSGFEFSAATSRPPIRRRMVLGRRRAAGAAWTAAGNAAFAVTPPPPRRPSRRLVADRGAVGRRPGSSRPVAARGAEPGAARRAERPPRRARNTLAPPAPLAAQIIAGNPGPPKPEPRDPPASEGPHVGAAVRRERRPGLLVTGVVALPKAGVNLAERPLTGFRWYVVPITGPGASSRRSAPAASSSGRRGAERRRRVGDARAGLTDPDEYRVDPP